MCSRESEHPGFFVWSAFICFLKAGMLGEISGEDLNRIFINFMLMYQNEIYSLIFICPGVWLAKGTNWISAIYLPELDDLSYLPSG